MQMPGNVTIMQMRSYKAYRERPAIEKERPLHPVSRNRLEALARGNGFLKAFSMLTVSGFLWLFIAVFLAGCVGFAEQKRTGWNQEEWSTQTGRMTQETRMDSVKGDEKESLDQALQEEEYEAGQKASTVPVRMHFAGWNHFPEDRGLVEDTLRTKGIVHADEADLLLEITLEQTHVTPGLQRLGNAILTIASFTLVPFFERYEYRLRFVVMDAGGVTLAEQYCIKNHIFTSLLALPLMPVYWPPDARQEAVEASATDFSRRFRRTIP